MRAKCRGWGVAQRGRSRLLDHEPLEQLRPKVLELVLEALGSDRAALLLEEDGELVQRAVRGPEGEELSVSRTIAQTVMDKQVSVLTADAGVGVDLLVLEGAL